MTAIASGRMLFAPHALLPEGWAANVLLAWDDAGSLLQATPNTSPTDGVAVATGPLLPGMPNLHSHAFQRAFAGLTEYRGAASSDSFWTWRDLMYRFALAVSPEQLELIATQLYIEMLQAGFTSVCEFHYVHHDGHGQPYANPAEMSLRLVAAAKHAGIGITLLPVLYQHSGFGGQAPRDDQRRFVQSVDGLLSLVERLRSLGVRVGVAPHSLRAVAPEALAELVAGITAMDASAPIHIHIAEQQQEVDDCVAWSGLRPVQWLLEHADLDARWCLVHATHLDAAEARGMAASGAVVGLCPSTEANLGDGLFGALQFIDAGGVWGIGSDSHASVGAAEELRLLEYGQRLLQQRRNVLATAAHAQVADALWLAAVRGGGQASGLSGAVAGLQAGQRADFVVLGGDASLAGLAPSQVLAGHVFASHGRQAVSDVWVGGHQRIAAGRHAMGDEALHGFVAARTQLLAAI